MRLPPMIASLTRHKLTVALMLLATAFTCAIVTNVALLIAVRMALVNAPSGLDESDVVQFDSSLIKAGQFNPTQTSQHFLPQYKEDVKALRGIAGVQSAAVVSGLPMDYGSSFGVAATPDAPSSATVYPSVFMGGPGELETLGLDLVHGRDFSLSQYGVMGHGQPSATIISRALAQRLFHTPDAAGRLLYNGDHALRVVGVVAHLMDMFPQLGADNNDYAMLEPLAPNGPYATFVLRTTPAHRALVLKDAVRLMNRRHPDRIVSGAETFSHMRAEYFQGQRSMIDLLLATGIGLLLVTAAGIAGLASFWVQQRTRSIGIRRALGASRADILRYTHVENFLIVAGGVLLGFGLAYGLNLLLMEHYAVHVLPPAYLGIGAVALWLMGQLAVLAPSLRAGAVAPAVATRSV